VGSRPKGLGLIINIREFQQQIFPLREGAEIDGQNMEALFTSLGYPTEIHYDLRSSVIIIFLLFCFSLLPVSFLLLLSVDKTKSVIY
jgi:hypothetical protein